MTTLVQIFKSQFVVSDCYNSFYFKWTLFVILCCFQNDNILAQKHELFSPNKSNQVIVELENDAVSYTFIKNEVSVVSKSLLGVELNEQLWKGWSLKEVSKDSIRSNWKPLWGTQDTYPDNYNAMVLKFQDEKSGSYISFVFRMYNEGLAFKYEIETVGLPSATLKKELTEFNISTDSKSWVLTHPWGKKYKKDVALNKVKNASLPLLSKSKNGTYILITEAELYHYDSLHLSANPKGGLSANIIGDVNLKSQFSTPWRVVMAADSPEYFVEHHYMIQNLNPPSKIKNSDWIQPGISTWDWRARGAIEDGFEYKLNTETLIRFIDKTAELGLPYFMIDAGWYGAEHEKASNPLTTIPEVDLALVMKEAKEKKVGIWLYVNRVAFENYDMDVLLSTYKKWGVVGIKLGFLREQNQYGVELLQQVLGKCAAYELMFNCHESVIPSGIERTWPHFLTREYNHSLMDGGYVAAPIDHTITPFLNNIAGPIDVTPGVFDLDKITERTYVKSPVKSTVVAQVAMCVTYFSPFLCLPDIPEAYQRKPDLFEFIKALPLSYDESKVLVGQIGESYVVARRKGNTWWIGGIANEEGANLEIPLQFLNTGDYKATIFSDGDNTTWEHNREDYIKEIKNVKSKDTIQLKMASGGGVSIKIESLK